MSVAIISRFDALDSRLMFSNNSGTHFISQQDMPECLLTNLGKYQLEGHPSNLILFQADPIMSIYPGLLIRFLIYCGTAI